MRSVILALALMAPGIARAQTNDESTMQRLTEYSLDELLNQDVTSVAKKPEQLSKSPAAISVLTQEDIQSSGARSIPEALRTVPGLDVAQVDSQQWAVSARGFNDIFADKLLVLQDGRSLYTPLFSGVFWDFQNPLLENIDRIEVVRGPGASLWGANAVNGVINIITKPASETQGFFAEGGGGNYEQDFTAARYGGKLGDDVYYRVDGQYFNRGDSVAAGGGNSFDAWRMGQSSFRVDWDKRKDGGDLVTLEGEVYGGTMQQVYNLVDFMPPSTVPTPDFQQVNGENILGRWAHSFEQGNDLTLQAYYDRTERNIVIFNEDLDTVDIDLQHHFTVDAWLPSDFVWGLGYRLSMDHLADTRLISFSDSSPQTELFSGFVQDEITLYPDRLRLTLGTKLEHNNYTGFEVQPDARLLWTPADRHTFWGAISRAVRTPSEAEEYVRLNEIAPAGQLAPIPVPLTIYGNQDFRSEDLLAYQLGYRVEVRNDLAFDIATFYNVYDNIRGEVVGPSPTQPLLYPPPPFGIVVPVYLANTLHGDSYGFELGFTWQVMDGWRLRASYSLLEMHLSGPDLNTINSDVGDSPKNQASLTSSMDLPRNVSLDATVRYVSRLPAFPVSSYVALDLRVAWRPCKHWEFSVVGQNLGSAHHAEFEPTFIGTQRTEVRAGGYAKVTCNF